VALGRGKTFTNAAALQLDIEQEIAKVVADVPAEVTKLLYWATPVDTTFARSNWVPSIGQPYTGLAGSKESPSLAEQDAGLAALRGYRLTQGNLYVANNIDYMEALDVDGHSPQASPGFVGATIERAIDNIGVKYGGSG